MNPEPVIQSEVNQKEKNKYHRLMHIYIYIESREMVLMNLFARHREWNYGHKGGGREWDKLRE